MTRERTILESVEIVLSDSKEPLNYKEIFAEVIKRNLYEFGAKTPEHVLHIEIRRHCKEIEFPTASPVKKFQISYVKEGVNYYSLLKEDSADTLPEPKDTADTIDYVLDIEDEMLPEEKMVQAYQHYLNDLRFALIERVRACHPSFFEKMVVDLLLAMGYGCDDKSGQVIGKSHDGGIDGIISEDKLGLNLIYIQAKRYNEGNNVGRPEIQRFIGAMQRAEKGVFITTSKFTREAIEFANAENRKHIRLIDGDNLVELMIKHSVGLEKIKEYVVYKINEDYFSDLM